MIIVCFFCSLLYSLHYPQKQHLLWVLSFEPLFYYIDKVEFTVFVYVDPQEV